MRRTGKRSAAILLTLSMIVSLFAGLAVPAAAELTSEGGTVSPGEYTLSGDVALSSDLIISGAVTIDLAGHTLTGTGSGSVITVMNGGTLVLNDSVGTGSITGGIMKEDDADAWKYGAGVTVFDGGTFTMNGGAIAGNTSPKVGGVNVAASTTTATFIMNGGTIKDNTGTGLNVTGGQASATVGAGAIIRKNISSGAGGVAVMAGGQVTLNGGKIIENTANGGGDGGGVVVGSGGTFIMESGEVCGNTSTTWGGGVAVMAGDGTYTCGTFIMKGGVIRDNTAGGKGGGVSINGGDGVYPSGVVQLSGSPEITGNTTTAGAANNVFLASGITLTNSGLTGGTIGVTVSALPEGDSTVTVLTGSSSSDDAARFTSDADGFAFEQRGNVVVLKPSGSGDPTDPVPAGGITRAELAVLVYNKFMPTLTKTGSELSFGDIGGCTLEQQQAIKAMAAAGIIAGTSDGKFNPDGKVSRWQAALIIWRAAGKDENAAPQELFDDVGSITGDTNADSMFARAFNSLVALGVLTADDATDGKFNPTDKATVENVTTWLGRLFTRAELAEKIHQHTPFGFSTQTSSTAASVFADVTACSDNQKTAIGVLYEKKILSGTSANTFTPGGAVTRAQAAVVIWRAAGSLSNKTPANIPYTDVSSTMWYSAAINCLYAMEVLDSSDMDSAGKFNPNGVVTAQVVDKWLNAYRTALEGGSVSSNTEQGGVTRAELVLVFYNRFKDALSQDDEEDEEKGEPPFIDIAGCTPEQKEAITYFYWLKIIVGTSEITFDPYSPPSNGQTAMLLSRIAQRAGAAQPEPSAALQSVMLADAKPWYADAVSFLVDQGALTEAQAAPDVFNGDAPGTETKLNDWSGDVALAPLPTPAAGVYISTQSVTLKSLTAGATIYYTIDGSDPTTSSTPYTGPITVSSTTTIKSIAVVDESVSSVATAVYTIDSEKSLNVARTGDTVCLTNRSAGTVSVQMVLTAYDTNDRMCAVSTGQGTLNPGGTLELPMITGATGKVKAFLLDPETKAPLCKAKEVN